MIPPEERLRAALVDRYGVERELGQGGMATVYLAEDLKHKRRVAIKVLKPELAAVLGADRFIQEITTTARLQHPNILPLFDSGNADGFLYYVMPYVEGETLRAKLDRERLLGIDEAVKLVGEVADALQYAHERGVVHRDIKPENILLHGGRPMVADFGIALALSAAADERVTQTGLSLGTPHYMSPEQATAEKHVSARSDVYSLGAVLFELLTGQPPHFGGSAQQIIGRIVTDPAPLVTQMRKSVPANVAAAVSKALEKLPADRFESAESFAEALTNPAFVSSAGAATTLRAPGRQATVVVLAAMALVASGLAVWGWTRRPPTLPQTAVRFIVPLAPDQALDTRVDGPRVAISRDGRTLAFVGRSPNERQLYVRELRQPEPRALPGTEGAYNPTFSPDGRWIAFVTTNKMQKVDLATNQVTTLTELPSGSERVNGMAWGDDDTLLFIQGRPFRVPAAGGTPRALSFQDTMPTGQEPPGFNWPELLPGGDVAIFNAEDDGNKLELMDLRSGERRTLLDGNYVARYAPPGHLLIQSDDRAVSAVPFDVRRGRITGSPVPLLPSVGRGPSGSGDFAVSATGVLAFVAAGAPRRTIVVVDRKGQERTLIARPATYANPKISPDGRVLAFAERTGERSDIWLYDLARTTFTRLTFESDNFYPTWSPDGGRVAFASRRDGGPNIYVLAADGTGQIATVSRSGLSFPGSFTPDGRTLVFRTTGATTGFDILAVDVGDPANARTVLQTRSNESAPALSPDGSLLAYVSDETGRNEVYLRRYPGGDGRWAVSVDGGSEPVWRRDGRELFFRNGTGLYAATIDAVGGAVPRIGHVTLLFQGPYARVGRWAEYDVMPDGNQFVMVSDDTASVQLQVATRWSDLTSAPANAEER